MAVPTGEALALAMALEEFVTQHPVVRHAKIATRTHVITVDERGLWEDHRSPMLAVEVREIDY